MSVFYRAFLFLTILITGHAVLAQNDLPKEFKQLLPRGAIAAVFKPNFVSAAEADISNDTWVLGVVIDGHPKAYSLNLLNSHEVVNDRIAGTVYAAVW